MEVRLLDRSRKDEAVQVLSRSFSDYPVMRYVLRDSGSDYDHHLEGLISFFCECRLARGWPLLGVLRREEVVAAAVVSEPNEGPGPDALNKELESLREQIGTGASDRLDLYDRVTDEQVPTAPHHYLGMIGVEQAFRGQGFGKRLVEKICQTADEDPVSTGVCLNTETAKNVPLYGHLGFRVLDEADVGDIHTWCMFYSCPGMEN